VNWLCRLAHIGASHQAGRALAASPPDGEDGEISYLYATDRGTDLDHLAEHLVADDEFFLTLRSIRASSRHFFPVRAADAYAFDFDLYFI
jgi:hypothetical protein